MKILTISFLQIIPQTGLGLIVFNVCQGFRVSIASADAAFLFDFLSVAVKTIETLRGKVCSRLLCFRALFHCVINEEGTAFLLPFLRRRGDPRCLTGRVFNHSLQFLCQTFCRLVRRMSKWSFSSFSYTSLRFHLQFWPFEGRVYPDFSLPV